MAQTAAVRSAVLLGLLGLVTSRVEAEQLAEEPLATPESPDRSEVLRLERRIDALSAELQKLKQLPQQSAAQPPRVRVSGLVQIDWVVSEQSSENELAATSRTPLNQERFLLRRGRLRAEGDAEHFGAVLEIDANTIAGLQVRPINAELNARAFGVSRLDRLQLTVRAGLIRIPFGFEVQESDAVRPFLERATSLRALFPGQYDVGASLTAQYQYFQVGLAAMNGHPIGDRLYPAMDPSRQKDVLGRFGARAALASGVELSFGMSGLTGTGFHAGTPTSKDQLVWRDDNGDGIVQATEIGVVAGAASTPARTFHRFAVGCDLQLVVSTWRQAPFQLRMEAVRASNLDRAIEPADPVDTGYDLREWGAYVGVTQGITRYGLLGVRYDYYQPDNDARSLVAMDIVPRNRRYSTLALMAAALYGNGRLLIEYDVNRNSLGRDLNGAPTNLKSNALTVRGQLRF